MSALINCAAVGWLPLELIVPFSLSLIQPTALRSGIVGEQEAEKALYVPSKNKKQKLL